VSIPELWNTTEVARFLGIKPTSVSAYRIRGQMPPPVQTVGKQTHLWDADTIRAWHAQRPGTPDLDAMSEQERAAYYEANAHRLDDLFDTDNPVEFEGPAQTNYAVAPGEYITEWLEENQVSAEGFAHQLGVAPSYVAALLGGQFPLPPPLQVALADLTGIPADSWARLDTQFWLDKARLEGHERVHADD
jgi:plasmid maintenance system antidote protein VapI